MRLKTRLMLAAVPVTAVAITGTIIVVRIRKRRRRRARINSFLSEDIRGSLKDLCSLQGEDFVPDGLGSSRYQRKLESLTDRQLVGLYLLIKSAEVLRSRGIDITQLSREDVIREVASVREASHNKQDRRELLRRMSSFSAETARSVLDDGLLLAGAGI